MALRRSLTWALSRSVLFNSRSHPFARYSQQKANSDLKTRQCLDLVRGTHPALVLRAEQTIFDSRIAHSLRN
jgi:hypothetical protein